MRQTLIAALAVLACAPLAHAQSQVTIGSASPLSGPSAHQGKDIENGARLAIDDLRDAALTLYTYRKGQLTKLRVVRDSAGH